MPLDKRLSRREHAGVVRFILDPHAQLASQNARRQINRRVQRRCAHHVLWTRGNICELQQLRLEH